MTEMERSPFDVDDQDDSGRPHPWAPQPGETDLGFHLFCLYRDLPPGKRSIAALARESGKSREVLRALSAKFSFEERALSFDAYLDARAVEELARGRTKMKQEHADIAILARKKILSRLQTMDPLEMGARDLAAWLDLSVKIERQARGEADRKVEVSGEVSMVEKLDAASRRSLMAEALAVLNERLGVPAPLELEAYEDAEIVEDDDDGRSSQES